VKRLAKRASEKKGRFEMKTNGMMEIFGVVRRGEGKAGRGFWTRIGTAFKNRDGSLNLRFDFLPADLASTTIQVREPKAAPEPAAADPFEGQVADT
jgi:hypothetical protein